MKRYLNLLIAGIFALTSLMSCDFYALDNVWDPELENVFYCGYDEWIAQRTDGTNKLKYTISKGESATMPFRLWSEFTRDFDVNVPIYVYPDENLALNVDFKVTDSKGNVVFVVFVIIIISFKIKYFCLVVLFPSTLCTHYNAQGVQNFRLR